MSLERSFIHIMPPSIDVDSDDLFSILRKIKAKRIDKISYGCNAHEPVLLYMSKNLLSVRADYRSDLKMTQGR